MGASRAWSSTLTACLAVLAGAAGCGDRLALEGTCGHDTCPAERTTTDLFQQRVNRELDVLFVVDDTPAIEPLLATLPDELRHAAQVLEAIGGSQPASLRVAVVRGSLPTDGSSPCETPPSRGPACGLATGDRFTSTSSCGAMPNFTLPFEDTLVCLADLGSEACGAFQPFEVARRALDPGGGSDALAGFLRPDAYLAVVVVGASDDASTVGGTAASVSDFAGFLRSLKADPTKVTVGVAGPPLECADGAAPTPAPRLKAFTEAFGNNGTYDALCSGNPIALVLEIYLQSIQEGLSLPCIGPVLDTDLATPGLQADCTVEDVSWDGSETRMTVLHDCALAPAPCWRLTADAQGCGSELRFEVDRGPGWCAQDGFTTSVTCLACVDPADPACVSSL
jgi:hypothetical protein